MTVVPATLQATIKDSASGMSLAYSAGEQDARTWAEQGVHLLDELQNSTETVKFISCRSWIYSKHMHTLQAVHALVWPTALNPLEHKQLSTTHIGVFMDLSWITLLCTVSLQGTQPS